MQMPPGAVWSNGNFAAKEQKFNKNQVVRVTLRLNISSDM